MAAGKTIPALLGATGVVSAILGIPAIFARMPTYGPRLAPGELKAGEASQRAEAAYWKAERLAARGACSRARREWNKAEAYQKMVRKREAKGDQTGLDLRDAIRSARGEIRRCSRVQ